MAILELIGSIILIVLILRFGYKLLVGLRKAQKFNREWRNVPDKKKAAFLKDKGPLSRFEQGAFTRVPRSLELLAKLLALAVIMLILGSFIYFLFFSTSH